MSQEAEESRLEHPPLLGELPPCYSQLDDVRHHAICRCVSQTWQALHSCGAAIYRTVCCTKCLSTSLQIVFLWLILVMGSIGASFAVAFISFTDFRLEMSPSDQRLVPKDLSPIFCESVDLTSGSVFTAYLLSQTPHMDPYRREQFKIEIGRIPIPQYEYHFWNFYLLADSKLTVHICAPYGAVLYIIKGESNMAKWTESGTQGDTYKHHIAPTGLCNEEDFTDIDFTTLYNDVYYVVIADTYNEVILDILLDRTVYDYDTLRRGDCSSGLTSCYFNLMFAGTEEVLVTVPINASFANEIIVHCGERAIMFFLIFQVIPFAFGTAVTALLYSKRGRRGAGLNRQDSTDSNYSNISESSPFVPTRPPPSYNALVNNGTLPPPYPGSSVN